MFFIPGASCAGVLVVAVLGVSQQSEDPATAAELYRSAAASAAAGDSAAALAGLRRARAAGFGDRSRMVTDPALQALRGTPEFHALLPPLRELDQLFREQVRTIHSWTGEAAGDQFGWVARRVGDLNQDGVEDFVTSAPTHATGGPAAGRVYVYSGRDGELLFQHDGKAGQRLGSGAAWAGDVDGDDVLDVIVGGPSQGNLPGVALVLSGKSGEPILELSSGNVGDQFGVKLSGVGDLDQDGHADVAVGAMRANTNGTSSGAVYVFSGAAGELLYRLDGVTAGDQFGSALTGGGDPDYPLLVVGAMTGGERNTGQIFVYEPLEDEAFELFTIDGDATSANLGQYFVTLPGDVNGDDVPDVYASDWNNHAGGRQAGRVYVVSGDDGEPLLTLTGKVAGEGFGTSVSDAGDVDRDGHADFIVGAWQNNEGARSGGKCSLFSGRDGSLLTTYTCLEGGDTLGFDATGIGDVDGDGGIDFLLTSAWSYVHGPQTGRVFIVAGPVFDSD